MFRQDAITHLAVAQIAFPLFHGGRHAIETADRLKLLTPGAVRAAAESIFLPACDVTAVVLPADTP